MYIKKSKDLLAKCYQDNKERLMKNIKISKMETSELLVQI